MRKIVNRNNFLYVGFYLFLFIAMTSSLCNAEISTRMNKREFYGVFQQMGGDKTTGSESGVTIGIEVDDFTVFGFGCGYNMNENINIGLNLLFGSTDFIFDASGYGISMGGSADTSVMGYELNLDVNILKNQITPMITGGIGFFRFSGDIGSSSFSETDFSYNIGFGVRWDATDHFLIKGLYKMSWTTLEDTDEKICLNGLSVGLGYMF